MNLKTQRETAIAIAATFPGGLPRMPAIVFDTIAGLGGDSDGLFYSCRFEVAVRRRPTSCDWKFLLAHELAHAWQFLNDLPYCETQADLMAMHAVGYSHFDLPRNRIARDTATQSPVTQFSNASQ